MIDELKQCKTSTEFKKSLKVISDSYIKSEKETKRFEELLKNIEKDK